MSNFDYHNFYIEDAVLILFFGVAAIIAIFIKDKEKRDKYLNNATALIFLAPLVIILGLLCFSIVKTIWGVHPLLLFAVIIFYILIDNWKP